MFGEITLMAWMGGAIVLAIGGGAGFFLARQIKDKRTLELEQQLEATQNKLSEYQQDVNRHFLKTSLLFNKLTDNYRDVYEHLATGAQKLCTDKPLVSALDLPKAKILSAALPANAADAADAADANTVNKNPETDTIAPISAETSAEAKHNDSHAGSAQLGAESIVSTENITATNTEAAPAENAEQSEQIIAEQATTDPAPTEALATEPASTETETATIETKPTDDRPTISPEELKTLEAEEQKKTEEEDIHLGAESTPGVEPKHHKTHPSIH